MPRVLAVPGLALETGGRRPHQAAEGIPPLRDPEHSLIATVHAALVEEAGNRAGREESVAACTRGVAVMELPNGMDSCVKVGGLRTSGAGANLVAPALPILPAGAAQALRSR